MTQDTIWKAALDELAMQMTKATFNTWLKDTELITQSGNHFTISVRNEYAKDWLENRLSDIIVRTLSGITAEKATVTFVIQESATDNGRYANGHSNYAPPPPPVTEPDSKIISSSGLNIHFTFGTFVVGPSNRLAHAAALSVAENAGKTYNPLFIYGGVGLGKTHLLHAIGHSCIKRGQVVRYLSSETFTNDLIQSIRNKQMADFRERYRTPDVLLIDDIQFIAGKESTQEELFHTFNDLHSRGKQVVLSSDRAPKAMVTLEERLQSRFEWGLMADVQHPNLEMRKAILQTKAEERHVDVPDDVLEFIANNVRKNIRELEGALNKVVAYGHLYDKPVDLDLVQMALADIVKPPEKVTIARVIQVVCEFYNVTTESILGSRRSRNIAFPRQIAMYLARTETDASLPQIGNHIGNRDHTTVLYGYGKIKSLVDTDANVRREVFQLRATLHGEE